MEKTISFRLELELAKRFKIALITKGETAQAVLEKAVKAYVEKN
jgi:predicted DNA-binding protein